MEVIDIPVMSVRFRENIQIQLRHTRKQNTKVLNIFVFSVTTSLKLHQQSKHQGITFSRDKCKCEFGSTYQVELKRHNQAIHEGLTYLCDNVNIQPHTTQISKDIRNINMTWRGHTKVEIIEFGQYNFINERPTNQEVT